MSALLKCKLVDALCNNMRAFLTLSRQFKLVSHRGLFKCRNKIVADCFGIMDWLLDVTILSQVLLYNVRVRLTLTTVCCSIVMFDVF